MSQFFKPGDTVIWAKRVSGDFCFPVKAPVLSTTAKRVKISAHDPDERGEGMVVRYVSPDSLYPEGS
ncbi:hypothetical protein [Vacuolonema iberomarrocanum]|uniref:hypothetical protein n=1 Tax=Vacuolonema iberomarrocanum TaxID=3454632 RepID=UPI0019F30DBB|nr:hypothetical protein [filamentous cyanobacterium LEGE 07170]